MTSIRILFGAVLALVLLANTGGIRAEPTLQTQLRGQSGAEQSVRPTAAGSMALAQADSNAGPEISWQYQVEIVSGKLDDLHALIAEMAAHAEANEPGTLTYHWTISEDGTIGHIQERYADAEAALAHLASYNSQFADRLAPLVSSATMFVNGDPGAEVRQQIAGANPIYMQDAGGFVRGSDGD
ncbi:MAG: antibiotic biosynthesis monooxygenase [Pseudomonadota bacterium]